MNPDEPLAVTLPAWVRPCYPPNHLLSNASFCLTSAAKALASQPMGFIDVGARGGVHELVAPIAARTAVLGFEPDEAACTELNRSAQGDSLPWAQFKALPIALAERRGPARLHLCSAPTNHSLRPVNRAFAARYRMEKFTQVGVQSLVTEALDDVLFGSLATESHWGEFIKLDTQGTEHEILAGAKRTLAERTVALFVEVEFCPIYEGQKLFSDLEIILRESGFTFFGFHSLHERSRKLLDKRSYLGRERLLHADAVFFKDPLPGSKTEVQLARRAEDVLFVCALLLGYFDFALELAEATSAKNGTDLSVLRKLVEDLAYYDPGAARRAALDLAQSVSAHPHLANVAIGRFVDERRAICNFEDVLGRLG